ncbi:putative ribosomal protein L4 domain superfamily [Helianthus anomalus]
MQPDVIKAITVKAKRRARWNNCLMFYCSNGSHKIVLACGVFNVPIRKDIIHRVVRWQLDKGQQVLYISLIHNLILEYQ